MRTPLPGGAIPLPSSALSAAPRRPAWRPWGACLLRWWGVHTGVSSGTKLLTAPGGAPEHPDRRPRRPARCRRGARPWSSLILHPWVARHFWGAVGLAKRRPATSAFSSRGRDGSRAMCEHVLGARKAEVVQGDCSSAHTQWHQLSSRPQARGKARGEPELLPARARHGLGANARAATLRCWARCTGACLGAQAGVLGLAHLSRKAPPPHQRLSKRCWRREGPLLPSAQRSPLSSSRGWADLPQRATRCSSTLLAAPQTLEDGGAAKGQLAAKGRSLKLSALSLELRAPGCEAARRM